jgi:hypothetical protein
VSNGEGRDTDVQWQGAFAAGDNLYQDGFLGKQSMQQPADADVCCAVLCLYVQDKCHPQTIAVCQTRADGLGLKAEVVKGEAFEFGKDVCGVLVQYPDTQGTVKDYKVGVMGFMCVCLWGGCYG